MSERPTPKPADMGHGPNPEFTRNEMAWIAFSTAMITFILTATVLVPCG